MTQRAITYTVGLGIIATALGLAYHFGVTDTDLKVKKDPTMYDRKVIAKPAPSDTTASGKPVSVPGTPSEVTTPPGETAAVSPGGITDKTIPDMPPAVTPKVPAYKRPAPEGQPPKERFKNEIAALTELQEHVTQHEGTEKRGTGEYFRHKEEGLYVDIVSGEPLFSSLGKFDSHCGWPAYFAPIDKSQIVEITDNSLGMERIEVRSKIGDSHLGHVFDGDPDSPNGIRYCINSASIRFIARADLEQEGYGEYVKLFEAK